MQAKGPRYAVLSCASNIPPAVERGPRTTNSSIVMRSWRYFRFSSVNASPLIASRTYFERGVFMGHLIVPALPPSPLASRELVEGHRPGASPLLDERGKRSAEERSAHSRGSSKLHTTSQTRRTDSVSRRHLNALRSWSRSTQI